MAVCHRKRLDSTRDGFSSPRRSKGSLSALLSPASGTVELLGPDPCRVQSKVRRRTRTRRDGASHGPSDATASYACCWPGAAPVRIRACRVCVWGGAGHLSFSPHDGEARIARDPTGRRTTSGAIRATNNNCNNDAMAASPGTLGVGRSQSARRRARDHSHISRARSAVLPGSGLPAAWVGDAGDPGLEHCRHVPQIGLRLRIAVSLA
jgi:hypothetical protein